MSVRREALKQGKRYLQLGSKRQPWLTKRRPTVWASGSGVEEPQEVRPLVLDAEEPQAFAGGELEGESDSRVGFVLNESESHFSVSCNVCRIGGRVGYARRREGEVGRA